MKTASKIIALAFVLMMIVSPFAAADDTSGAIISHDVKVTKDFDDMGGGTIEVKITGCDLGSEYIVKATNENKSDTYASSKFTATEETKTVSLSWNFGSSGDKTIMIVLCDGEGKELSFDGGFHISVAHSIWKDWTTYVAILIVVILIIVAAYIKMRGLPGSGKAKKKKTFAQMEAEKANKSTEKKSFFSKKEETPAIEQPAKNDTTSTEKQQYTPGRGFFKKRDQ